MNHSFVPPPSGKGRLERKTRKGVESISINNFRDWIRLHRLGRKGPERLVSKESPDEMDTPRK
jgi:hypothetical protein